jgi:hypothetical protein
LRHGNQFVGDESNWYCTVRHDLDPVLGIDLNVADPERIIEVATDVLKIDPEVEFVGAIALVDALMGPCNRRDTVRGLLQVACHLLVVDIDRLGAYSRGNRRWIYKLFQLFVR